MTASAQSSTDFLRYHLQPASGSTHFRQPLVFVHGAWHGAWCWNENFLSYFAKRGFEVLALDLPKHGELARKNQSMRWLGAGDYVGAVAAITDQLDRPPILIGHSMGGYVVQKYMEKYRIPGSAMILLASVPPAGVLRTALSLLRHYPLQFMEVLLTMKLYPLIRKVSHSRAHFFSESISEADLSRYHDQMNDEAFLAFLDMLALRLPRKKRIRGVPALVLGARNDHIFTPKEVRATATAYDAELTIFPDMAHDMMLEPGWEAVADCMIAWLRSLKH